MKITFIADILLIKKKNLYILNSKMRENSILKVF